MRKIVLVAGIANSVANFRGPLIAELVGRGDRVLALAPDWDDEQRTLTRALGAEPLDYSLERTGMRLSRDLVDIVRLWRRLRRLKPDTVLCYSPKAVNYGTLAAAAAGVRRRVGIVEGLGYVFTEGEGAKSLKRRALRFATMRLYTLALAFAHRVLFLNRDDRALFVSSGMVNARKTEVIGGIGVDLTKFTPTPFPDQVTFLLIARLLREKGIGEFVAAARLVRARFPAARFILLGPIDSNPGGLSRDQILAWVAEGILEWPGEVSDVREWIARASVYVLPSYREGVPKSTQEAMAMGRPVITTDAVGCRETVDEGVNGFMVPIRSIEPLAQAMFRFLEDPALIASMGAQSRRIAETRFDVHLANQRLLDALDGRSAE
ncbi:glycosyltransferase family 4 protein [Sphingomonas sp. M1-B02]|uniref:glycosyltransferase family 4 protein n=1 Tax=Sphingomonas sp. M1-B02 TaxID=3114300 RepID=UPI002240C3CB|nr:glycosyltransferase family 4 protein [Sphingomonas sp. S6-11]UZK65034.1 glycosyltransferase family 4 protein [Sphingomonas sp. S6-11]